MKDLWCDDNRVESSQRQLNLRSRLLVAQDDMVDGGLDRRIPDESTELVDSGEFFSTTS